MTRFSMDRVAELVREQGVTTAYVEYTGGGCATIFAGEQAKDEHGDMRWQAAAGPGWFDPPMGTPGGCKAYGDTDEFYVGVDDDGANDDVYTVTGDDTEETIAAKIVALCA